MANYKDYMQRILEAQTIYRGSDQASPSVPAYGNNQNLGAAPGAGPMQAMSDGRVFDNIDQMLSVDNPDLYNIGKWSAQTEGPEINSEIQGIDSQITRVYLATQPLVQGDPVLMSKLDSYSRAQQSLYREWMAALKGFTSYMDDMEILRYRYGNVLAEILKFNASV